MISNHVPSLDLCKKLRDLGWKKETMFFWKCDSNGGWTVEYRPSWDHHIRLDIIDATIPAPTVGEMLPEFPKGTIFRSEITPDEMAENLCDLLENNLVKLEEKE